MSSVVIIGASHAAAEAISVLRRAGWQGSIHLVGDEDRLPYQRPPLSKDYFKGEMQASQLFIRNDDFYVTNDVALHLGRKAMHIDRENKKVFLDDDSSLQYEHLILATGTRPRLLPLSNINEFKTHYLRTMADVEALKADVNSDSRLLIIGAGYIGLELAASATKQGMSVTVLESEERVLARVTSPEVSQFYQAVHAQAGVDIKLNARLESLRKEESANIAKCHDGAEIEFDVLIIGIGVLPNQEIAAEAGLTCENGIVVDEFTRTLDPNIYAVGDCSQHPSLLYGRNIRLESVPNASGQAKTAAMAICGDAKPYDQVPWFWSDQYDIKLQTVGLLQGYDTAVVRGDTSERKFAVFYLKDGVLIAVDAINSPPDFMMGKRLVAARKELDATMLANPEVNLRELAK